MDHQPFWKIQLMMVAIAITGGIAKYSNDYLSGKDFSWGQLFATAVVSVFTGYMFGTFSMTFVSSIHHIIIFTGIGSYTANLSMEYLFKKLTNNSV